MVIGPQASASKPARMTGMIFDFIFSSLVKNGSCFIKVPEFYVEGEKSGAFLVKT
jgi:hypothetical protein